MLVLDKIGPIWQRDSGARHAECLAWLGYWDESGGLRQCAVTADQGWKIEPRLDDVRGVWHAHQDDLGLAVTIELNRAEPDLILTIPRDKIQESGGCRLKSVRPFPGWISGREGDGGALILPYEEGGLCRHAGKAPGEHDSTLTETTFENGARLLANYADSPAELTKGRTIPPHDFVVC